jgi:membrane protease YdiL (CAAX protease family)
MTTGVAVPQIETTVDSSPKVRRARQSLLVFAIFLIPLSLFGYWFNVKYAELPLNFPIFPLMLAPGLASVITRLVRGEGFADVSFRLRGPRMGSAFRLAFALPLVVGTVAYGTAYLLGLAKFDPPAFPFAVSPALAQFGLILVLAATLALLLSFPTTAGEEIGWRGYLLPRIIEARISHPILLSSLIWGAWHLPVLLAGVYAVGPSRLLSAAGLMLATLAFGAILAWLRLATGSIWPVVIAHAAWNALINAGFTFATQNPSQNIWIGETGILVAGMVVIAALLLRGSWSPRQLGNE